MPQQELEPRQSGPFTNNGKSKSNNARCNENFAELFKTTMTCEVVPNGPSRARFVPPAGRTLAGVEAKRETAIASAAGDVTFSLKRGELRLLSAVTVDAKTLTGEYAAQTLNGTAANLVFADGDMATLLVESNNLDATGGPVILRLTWALQPQP